MGWHTQEDLLRISGKLLICHAFQVSLTQHSVLGLSKFKTHHSICTTNKVCPRKFDNSACICATLPAFRYIMHQRGHVDAVQSRPEHPMHLAVVTCGDRLEETLTMIKSAVLFSIKSLYLHIFAEDQLHASFMEAVSTVVNTVVCKITCKLLSVVGE